MMNEVEIRNNEDLKYADMLSIRDGLPKCRHAVGRKAEINPSQIAQRRANGNVASPNGTRRSPKMARSILRC